MIDIYIRTPIWGRVEAITDFPSTSPPLLTKVPSLIPQQTDAEYAKVYHHLSSDPNEGSFYRYWLFLANGR